MTLQAVNELTARALEVPEEAESSLAEDVSGEGQGFVRLLVFTKPRGWSFRSWSSQACSEAHIECRHESRWHTIGPPGSSGSRSAICRRSAAYSSKQNWRSATACRATSCLICGHERAKRKLVLSAGLPKQLAHDSALKMIIDGFGIDPDILKPESEVSSTDVSLDGGIVSITVVSGKAVPLSAMRRDAVAWQDLNDNIEHIQGRWKARLLRRDEYVQWPAVLSPSLTEPAIGWRDELSFHGRRAGFRNGATDRHPGT